MKDQPSDDPDLWRDEPPPPGFMDRPEVKAAIEVALERARKGGGRKGSSAEDLLRLAREQRRLGPRPKG